MIRKHLAFLKIFFIRYSLRTEGLVYSIWYKPLTDKYNQIRSQKAGCCQYHVLEIVTVEWVTLSFGCLDAGMKIWFNKRVTADPIYPIVGLLSIEPKQQLMQPLFPPWSIQPSRGPDWFQGFFSSNSPQSCQGPKRHTHALTILNLAWLLQGLE